MFFVRTDQCLLFSLYAFFLGPSLMDLSSVENSLIVNWVLGSFSSSGFQSFRVLVASQSEDQCQVQSQRVDQSKEDQSKADQYRED